MAWKEQTRIHMAGVCYVAAKLCRRGVYALPTQCSDDTYKIVVKTTDGKKQVTFRVHTSSRQVRFWPTPPSKRICPTDNYVLVRWLADRQRFECFLLTGRQAKEAVAREENTQRERMRATGRRRKLHPSIHLTGEAETLSKTWKGNWLRWRLR